MQVVHQRTSSALLGSNIPENRCYNFDMTTKTPFQMSSEKLKGQALLDLLNKPETQALENNADKVRLAGYDPSDPMDQGQFVLQLKKARGWEPKPIKGNGDDWRMLQLSLCNAFSNHRHCL